MIAWSSHKREGLFWQGKDLSIYISIHLCIYPSYEVLKEVHLTGDEWIYAHPLLLFL